MKFKKRPPEIEATQWFKNGDHPNDYEKDVESLFGYEVIMYTGEQQRELGWEGQVVRYFRIPVIPGDKICEHCGNKMHKHGWIDSLRVGGYLVCPGDWIITEMTGEHYPCKPDIFEKTYEYCW